ncbi:MAG: 3-methyl-2-oxobutanoate hydroxymethyltransferase [Bdellovibrionales bacterium]|nr:3-methyl-2-oxobutanoate hydroxymethyltransferase [Bdellovibrionales bacterium]
MITVPEFKTRKQQDQKISMITCYDASFARVLAESPIDALLVGDSSVMTMQGYDSTVHATPESIEFFVASVARGAAGKKFIVADMPFLVTRKSREHLVDVAGRFLRAGAHAVKIEGIHGNEDGVRHLVESGIPVMGHLGLTPQFANAFGGMKVQAKNVAEQEQLLADARAFEAAGAFSLVLECIPGGIAGRVTEALTIPTIGIGAGTVTDGQVLVLQDMLGMNPGFKPKFLRHYAKLHEVLTDAFTRYHQDVMQGQFPSAKETYQSDLKAVSPAPNDGPALKEVYSS